jgi:hypothetical protein
MTFLIVQNEFLVRHKDGALGNLGMTTGASLSRKVPELFALRSSVLSLFPVIFGTRAFLKLSSNI